jgi:hypothetical protein
MAADYGRRYEEAKETNDIEGIRIWAPTLGWHEEYRTVEFVEREVTRLASQLAELAA